MSDPNENCARSHPASSVIAHKVSAQQEKDATRQVSASTTCNTKCRLRIIAPRQRTATTNSWHRRTGSMGDKSSFLRYLCTVGSFTPISREITVIDFH
ncbi:hypothetical protein G1C95_2397 [Bifidobacterium sp. DSM 109957]|uniref:Uncharacterized protein n=1 Tax=Bifidobacterium oedipodis TaxID=2675322 RepID=A0A7Y0HUX0_9BIFI|nr:hypothetical protein [Bifidobacterium sp. DSM 109957]NMM95209.1 hypothetical protein [Bifidobacterium sp. DSM 109957]